jgi:hypothetical protein
MRVEEGRVANAIVKDAKTSMSGARLMRLKYIAQADFRKNEHTNFLEHHVIKRGKKVEKRIALKPGEVACLVAASGKQIVFVYNPDRVMNGDGEDECNVLHSERLRLTAGGRWDPLMLGNYAAQVGIQLEGIRLFQQHYDEMTRERLRLRRLRDAS